MKISLLIVIIFCSSITYGQLHPPGLTFKFGAAKMPTGEVGYTTSLRNTSTKVRYFYNRGEYDVTNDYSPVYLDLSTLDFTVADENKVISYIESEETFYLNEFEVDAKVLLPQGSKLLPVKLTQYEEKVLITWILDDKELIVTFWIEELYEVVEEEQKKAQQKK